MPRSLLITTLIGIVICAAGPGCGHDRAEAGERDQRCRPEFEAIAKKLYEGTNQYFGRGQLAQLEGILGNPELSSKHRIAALGELARQRLRLGEVDEAIAAIDQAALLAETAEIPDFLAAEVRRWQGLAYLRQAEVQNCILRHNTDCCIFPLAGGGVHAVVEPAAEARRHFEAALKLEPRHVSTAWLLNVVAMALGDYPQAVPEQYRIPAEAFESSSRFVRFVDVAPQLGIDTFNLCGGVIADDFDGDDLIDIVTSTLDPRGSLHYYRNQGDGTFEDLSSASRLDDQLGGLNCIGADYDNDGDEDILILRGAWLLDDGQIRNSLVRNNGDGTFTDVTRAAGLAEVARPTQAGAWGDYDNDGDLDLYIVNESRVEFDGVSYPAELYRNNGDGTFTDVAAAAGVTNDRFGKGVAAGDYDNDGDLDLYVSNIGLNRLYRNDGGLRFTDVAPELHVTEPDDRSFAVWFFDYDNDGWLDLFVTAYEATVADVARDVCGLAHGTAPPCLYRNNSDGTFSNVTGPMDLDHAYLPMGANFGDVDGDGWLDLYLATGDPEYETLMPNVLLRNDRGRRFQNVTYAAGLGHLQKGHGVAFADFDEDGDQDLYHQLGGFYPGDRFQNALFVNPGHGNRWLKIRLVGRTSNRMGIGARIRVVIETPEGERRIDRAVGAVSSFGGSPMRQEIGLGDATRIQRLTISWPASGDRQVFTDVPLDSSIRILEGAEEYELLPGHSFELGESAAQPAPRSRGRFAPRSRRPRWCCGRSTVIVSLCSLAVSGNGGA